MSGQSLTVKRSDIQGFDEVSVPPSALMETPQAPPTHPHARVGELVKSLMAWMAAHPIETGAMVGGTAAVPLTGGASLLPSMAAAGLGGAGGAGLGAIVGAATGAEGPTTPTGVLGTMAAQGATMAAGEGVGVGVARGLSAGGQAVYRSLLKPSLSPKNIGEARTIVQTAIDEAIPIDGRGVGKATRLISGLNKQVDAILAHSRGTVDYAEIAARVRDWAQRTYDAPGASRESLNAALKVADSIDGHAASATDLVGAQSLKRTLYDRASDAAYGEGAVSAERQAAKEGGRATRQAIEREAATGNPAVAQLESRLRGRPDPTQVGALNAREGRLIETRDAVRQASERAKNNALSPQSLANIGGGVVGAAEGYRQRDAASGMVYALGARAALSPALLSRAAILASHLAREGGLTAATAARVAIQRVISGDQE